MSLLRILYMLAVMDACCCDDQLRESVERFCMTDKVKQTMTSADVTKCFTDCELYSQSLTSTDTHIAFSKVKKKGKL